MLRDSVAMPFVCYDRKIPIDITLMCYSNLMPDVDCTVAETLPFRPSDKMLSLHSFVSAVVDNGGHKFVWG